MYPRILKQWTTTDKVRHTRRLVQVGEGQIQYEYLEYDSMGGNKWVLDGGPCKQSDSVYVYTIIELFEEIQKLKMPKPPAKDAV